MLTRVLVVVVVIACVGGAAFWFLNARDSADPVHQLLEDIENASPEIRARAETEILSRGPELVPALVAVLEGAEATAAAASGGGSRAHVENTLNRERMRRQAMRAFALLGDKAVSASPQLVGMMESPDQALYAARALVGIGAAEALPPFQAHRETMVRFAVAAALGRATTEQSAAVQALSVSANDSEAQVRSAAMDSIGLLQADAARSVPILISGLEDPEGEVRAAAAKSLGAFGKEAEGAVAALQTAARDRHQQTRRAARRALELIQPGQ